MKIDLLILISSAVEVGVLSSTFATKSPLEPISLAKDSNVFRDGLDRISVIEYVIFRSVSLIIFELSFCVFVDESNIREFKNF